MKLSTIGWLEFKELSSAEKGRFLIEGERSYHTLIAQQFERKEMDALGSLATRIRTIAKRKEGMDYLQTLLSHKRAMLYFTQPSSRTFLSFCAACQIMGVKIGEVRDKSISSEYKGESQEDSVRTFSSYSDIIIMRSEAGGLAERMAWVLSNLDRPVPVINAGSGKDQHPTQGLLDVYTLQRSFETRGGIDGKTVMFVGDLARGRTVRSLAWLLTKYEGVKQLFVAPKQLQIGEDITTMLKEAGTEFELISDFDAALPMADAVYMTRIQDEWDTVEGESRSVDTSAYRFTDEHLSVLKKDGIIMHPLPRRDEIATTVDRDPRAMYWRQMRNGMWIRAALIASIFACEEQIHTCYENNLQAT